MKLPPKPQGPSNPNPINYRLPPKPVYQMQSNNRSFDENANKSR